MVSGRERNGEDEAINVGQNRKKSGDGEGGPFIVETTTGAEKMKMNDF